MKTWKVGYVIPIPMQSISVLHVLPFFLLLLLPFLLLSLPSFSDGFFSCKTLYSKAPPFPPQLTVCATRWLSIWRKEMWMSHDKLPENPQKGLRQKKSLTELSSQPPQKPLSFCDMQAGSISKTTERKIVCQQTFVRVS